MSCEKTGFHAYLVPYGQYLYGDAFMFGDAWLFRICEVSDKPIRDVKHYDINTYDTWFDQKETSQKRNSTMLASRYDVLDYGYKGVPVK